MYDAGDLCDGCPSGMKSHPGIFFSEHSVNHMKKRDDFEVPSEDESDDRDSADGPSADSNDLGDAVGSLDRHSYVASDYIMSQPTIYSCWLYQCAWDAKRHVEQVNFVVVHSRNPVDTTATVEEARRRAPDKIRMTEFALRIARHPCCCCMVRQRTA